MENRNIKTRNIKTIYSKSRGDRIGSQIHDDLFAYSYAFRNNYIFGGAIGNKRLNTHIKMCKLLGLPLPLDNKFLDKINSNNIIEDSEYRENENNINLNINTIFNQDFRNHLIYNYTYYSVDNYAIDNFKVIVSIHIRRGDVTPIKHPSRYLYNSYYINIINKIKDIPNTIINIYSESKSYENFDEFLDIGCNLYLDKSLKETWKNLINSNILIMSKSSFSYVPAIFNKNIVIYNKFWHNKLDHWLDSSIVSEDNFINILKEKL